MAWLLFAVLSMDYMTEDILLNFYSDLFAGCGK